MREALQNLSETYVANRHDGSGSVGREVRRRLQFNRDVLQRGWTLRGEAFADMAAERGHRLRGSPIIPVNYIGR